MSSVPVKLDFV